jgi:hypothetical protein
MLSSLETFRVHSTVAHFFFLARECKHLPHRFSGSRFASGVLRVQAPPHCLWGFVTCRQPEPSRAWNFQLQLFLAIGHRGRYGLETYGSGYESRDAGTFGICVLQAPSSTGGRGQVPRLRTPSSHPLVRVGHMLRPFSKSVVVP